MIFINYVGVKKLRRVASLRLCLPVTLYFITCSALRTSGYAPSGLQRPGKGRVGKEEGRDVDR